MGDTTTQTEQALLAQVQHLQSMVMGLEEDRLADACHIDRLAIQVQILRVTQSQLLSRVAELEARQC